MPDKDQTSSEKPKTKTAAAKSTVKTAVKRKPAAKTSKTAKAKAAVESAKAATAAAVIAVDAASSPQEEKSAVKEPKTRTATKRKTTKQSPMTETPVQENTPVKQERQDNRLKTKNKTIVTQVVTQNKITEAPQPLPATAGPVISPRGVTRISSPPRPKQENQQQENRNQEGRNTEGRNQDNRGQERNQDNRNNGNNRQQNDNNRNNRTQRDNSEVSYPFAAPETVGGDQNAGKRGNKRRRRNRSKNGKEETIPTSFAPKKEQQLSVEPKKLARKAWRIFLGEVTEDGLALMDDQSTKEVARRAFRVAEIFLLEELRRDTSLQNPVARAIQQNIEEEESSFTETRTEVEEFGSDDDIIRPYDEDEDDTNS